MEAALILKQAFDVFFQAPVQAWEDFASFCEKVHFKKGEVLKAANEKERFLYFIVKGSGGVFLWKGQNFVCLDFGFENHFFGDYMSFLTAKASPLQTLVLEPSEMLRLSREDYLQLGASDMGKLIMKVAAESSFINKQMQQIDLLTKTAEQRYHELMETQAFMLERVAQQHLASYLGITPQSLSRIRNKYRTKK